MNPEVTGEPESMTSVPTHVLTELVAALDKALTIDFNADALAGAWRAVGRLEFWIEAQP